MTLKLHNSLSKKLELFEPIDKNNVRMYVCGPTVYDRPHIGNARAVVVYDILFRLLKEIYGNESITYVRNITDVDDKINKAAIERKITIQELTKEITSIFHKDMTALNCLNPTVEPKATEHIKEMIYIIEQLIANNHAYVSNGHVYFSVESDKGYGKLAGREIEDMLAGVRIEVSEDKKHHGDFVLWKPADAEDDQSSIFESPWGKGRPGWHIECSAMSSKYLGNDFDIHGGGADLMFPHHTNEIAQSTCAFKGTHFARHWVHNGFLTVNGEKMSKSLGNFITVRELLEQKVKGEVIRYVLLATHYRKPLDWNDKALSDAQKNLDFFYRAKEKIEEKLGKIDFTNDKPKQTVVNALNDDLNTPLAFSILHNLASEINKEDDIGKLEGLAKDFLKSADMLGILQLPLAKWFGQDEVSIDIDAYIEKRKEAKLAKNFAEADKIREELLSYGITIEDRPGGVTIWRKS